MGQQFPVAQPEVLSQAAKSQNDIRAEIMKMRNEPVPEYIPPPRPAALIEATRLEMEEGARQNALAQANRAAMLPKPKPATEGSTEPVYRPGDHVPNLATDVAQHVPTKTYRVM
jgi:hypothetical protein